MSFPEHGVKNRIEAAGTPGTTYSDGIRWPMTVGKALEARRGGKTGGVPEPWTGYNPAGLTETYTYMAYFNRMSTRILSRVAIEPVAEIASTYGIKIASPNGSDDTRDYAPHLTIANAKIPDLDPNEDSISAVDRYVADHVQPAVEGMSIIPTVLIVNKTGMIYACALPPARGTASGHRKEVSSFPLGLNNVRGQLLAIYNHAGLKPTEYRDIAHTVVGRFMGFEDPTLPIAEKQTKYRSFLENLSGINRDLCRKRPELRFGDDFYTGRSINRATAEKVYIRKP